MKGYLSQPYSWFLSRNSADLGKTILSEVNTVINSCIFPFLTLIAQGMVVVAILILLLLVDPLLAISVGFVFGLAYLTIFLFIGNYLKKLGQDRMQANRERFTHVSEAFGAAKEVKIDGLERFYIERFAKSAAIFAKGQTTARVITQMPRFALEAIAFGGLLLVILYLMSQGGGFASSLPVVSLYAYAGYRLLPAFQQIYASFTQLRYAGPALDALHQEIDTVESSIAKSGNLTQISFNKVIKLNKVSYRYPNAKDFAVEDININIPVNSIVGFVGTTGSGKTTIVDLILSLLDTQKGYLSIDDQRITNHNKRSWQNLIGYVPQNIYLSDDSIAANIAFGVNFEDIDKQALYKSAKVANIYDFIINELPQGFDTVVGERGVRLSGGQLQRIGIARALYNNPQVLVFDEATSALDNLTEKSVMQSIDSMSHNITIIIIAHRLSTVRKCDQIYLLERGKVKASGNFDQLSKKSKDFALMLARNES